MAADDQILIHSYRIMQGNKIILEYWNNAFTQPQRHS